MDLFGVARADEPAKKARGSRVAALLQRVEDSLAAGRIGAAPKLAPNRRVHGVSSDLMRAAFCDYFGVRGENADVLVVLFENLGRPLPTKELARLLNSHRPPTRGAVHERIRQLRQSMESESLDSGGFLDSRGYQLTEVGVAECQTALKVMAEALTACGPAAMLGGQAVEAIRSQSDDEAQGRAA